jgi:hypothetical protein
VHLTKCVAWSPHGLNYFISFPPNFLTSNLGFHILGAPVGSKSFVDSFVVKAFHEDLGTISSLPMFVDPQAVFVMPSLCCANTLVIFFIQCFFLQVFCNIMSNSIFVP